MASDKETFSNFSFPSESEEWRIKYNWQSQSKQGRSPQCGVTLVAEDDFSFMDEAVFATKRGDKFG